MLNVFAIAHDSKIYGPGNRDVIWFKGCKFHCKNCINPELWSEDLEHGMSIDELIDSLNSKEITLLGGEPLQQKDILNFVKELKAKDFGIILFTGYELEELEGDKLLAANLCDVVISGRYIDELKDDSLYLRGSSNQVLTFNTNRYSKEEFEKPNSFEILISNKVESHGRSKNFVKELLDII